ncbi:MAG: hypothetical protein WKH64_18975 [Chloroflexia bacterium]
MTPASALTYLAQLRLQRRLRRAFDVAGEVRMMAQPATRTTRTSVGAELGYWVLADMRIGIGYNFTSATEPGLRVSTQPRGYYFTISTKLSKLFDLFGTSSDGLAPASGQDDQFGNVTANGQTANQPTARPADGAKNQ